MRDECCWKWFLLEMVVVDGGCEVCCGKAYAVFGSCDNIWLEVVVESEGCDGGCNGVYFLHIQILASNLYKQ